MDFCSVRANTSGARDRRSAARACQRHGFAIHVGAHYASRPHHPLVHGTELKALTSTMGHGRPLRTVFLSDVHLGSRACRVDVLLDFLRHMRCETLYLVGDIIDLESLRHSFFWPQSHSEVLKLLMQRCREGMRVVYVPGNHDDDLRAF